jgi:hypothetical protein
MPFCTAGRWANLLPQAVTFFQTGGIEQSLARGIGRIDRQIGEGQLLTGKIRAARELRVSRVEQVYEPVLVKLDRRIRHLLGHSAREKI